MSIISIIPVTLLLMGAAKKRNLPEPTPPPIVTEVGNVIFEPKKYYATKDEADMIRLAGKKMNEIVQSKEFFDCIKNRKLIQTNGRTPEQVAAHLQSIKGTVPVVMYYRRFTSAVAYRQPPSTTINLNRKYFVRSIGVCEWSSTMGHEALGHALGEYGHDFKWNKMRDFSVPYSINYCFEQVCKE